MSKNKGECSPETERLPLEYEGVVSQVNFLQGKVLTIIDASYPDGRQLEAVKDLVKNAFRDQLDWVAKICYPELPMHSRSELESMGINVDKVQSESTEE